MLEHRPVDNNNTVPSIIPSLAAGFINYRPYARETASFSTDPTSRDGLLSLPSLVPTLVPRRPFHHRFEQQF